MVTYCDPPSGWIYGFPKPMPKQMAGEEFTNWLVEEGYPQEMIDNFGDNFYCRFWSKEDES